MKKGKKLYEGKAKIIYATTDKNLTKMFDLNYHLKRINIIYKRVFK